jgi:hypothetical protein
VEKLHNSMLNGRTLQVFVRVLIFNHLIFFWISIGVG